MGEIPISLVFDFLIFLGLPFIFAALLKKIRLPPLVGYTIGGLVFGNMVNSLPAQEAIKNIAFFGILLLLFTVGLETNFSRILTLKRIILIGGSLQIILSIVLVFFITLFFHFSFLTSFLIAIALSSSSTTLVAKIIQDRGEESSFVGEVAMGILLFQDIAFIPFLIIFTSITSGGETSSLKLIGEILWSLVKSTIIIASLFYLGQKIIPYIFNRIARSSRELFNLFIILFIFFVTTLSLFLKIPTLIGVFMAGILLAQTIEHHHIFTEVRPLRDLLAVIFFVYIGTNIKLSMIAGVLPQIILFTLLVILAKAVIILMIFLWLKFHTRTSFNLSLYLFQIDEDAFILMSTALVNKLISVNDYLFVITGVLITLIITPILIKNKDYLYKGIRSFTKKYLPFLESFISYRLDSNQSPIDQLQIKNHVVICGYGRIGSYIGRSLMMANIPYIAVDYNLYIVEKAKKQGVNIIYGDPSDLDILDYAQVEEAMILVLAMPERYTQEAVVLNAKKLNKNIFIISRVHREVDQTRMKDLGVNIVVQPEFEASLSIIKKIYLWHRMEKVDIVNKIRRLKIEHGIA
ncbi:cation:proton antiporter [Candidatus Roizmanbacteria bacterium]|nr:cation:proton antiporter [Candidatus Roizmanbacteria bacterium]